MDFIKTISEYFSTGYNIMIKKNRHAYPFSIKSKNGRKIYRWINLMTGCEFLPLAIECKQY